MIKMSVPIAVVASCLLLAAGVTVADDDKFHHRICEDVPGHAELTAALKSVVGFDNAGLGHDMWATVVDKDGFVCAVTFSGMDRQAQVGIARVASAVKANTANSLSLSFGSSGVFSGLALSTANLWAAAQPGGPIFGIQFTNPVATDVAYRGNPARYGKRNDPMVGRRIGGLNVFGGGLGLYNSHGDRIGGLGLSGDSSCSDHIQAWKVRDALELDYVPVGVSPTGDDNIIFDLVDDAGGNPESETGFGHPTCLNDALEKDVAASLPVYFPIGSNP